MAEKCYQSTGQTGTHKAAAGSLEDLIPKVAASSPALCIPPHMPQLQETHESIRKFLLEKNGKDVCLMVKG